jgi:hypothetical protein
MISPRRTERLALRKAWTPPKRLSMSTSASAASGSTRCSRLRSGSDVGVGSAGMDMGVVSLAVALHAVCRGQ